MMIAFAGYAWSAAHYFMGAKYLRADLDRVSSELSDNDRYASIVSRFTRLVGFGRS